MQKSTDNLFYHYTTLDALHDGIIVSNPEKYKELCLWASHSDYLNDKTEISFSGRLIDEKIKHYRDGLFYSEYQKIVQNEDREVYILSFSKSIDSLPMWSMYGKHGKGVMLGLDLNIDDNFHKCEYFSAHELGPHIDDYLIKFDNLLQATNNQDFYYQRLGFLIELYRKRFVFKSRYFEYEDEYRKYIDPNYTLEQVISNSTPHCQVDFRISDNILVPYFKYYFGKNVLAEVWIGPSQDRELTQKSIRKFLDKNGFGHTKILVSDCPLRK